MRLIPSLVCVCVLILGGWMAKTYAAPTGKPVIVEVKNVDGQRVGIATVTEAVHAIRIKLDVKNLPPGDHSLHIHQVAKCEPPDFKSAGPHFGMHMGHGGAPAGDIPDFSLIVAADGTAHASVVAPDVTLGNDEHSVFS